MRRTLPFQPVHRLARFVPLAIIGLLVFMAMGTFRVSAQTNYSFFGAALKGISVINPTSLQFGPDGRLYVSAVDGTIYAYTIRRDGRANYTATNIETITLIKNIPNYNDNGAAATTINKRQITGIYVTGTLNFPVVYVASSDPRIGAGGGGSDTNLDTNSGIISRLTWTGTAWDMVHLVRGLPRSEENHANNGIQIDHVNNIMYVAHGGHNNLGGPSNNFAFLTEYAYSAAVLSIDLTALEAMSIKTDSNGQKYYLDLPTLDDPTRDNVNGINNPATPGYNGIDPGDPFGGNDGLNQAKITPDSPVQIYSPGFRNLYDIVITENGRMYGVDNGGSAGWGGHPYNEADYPVDLNGFNPAYTNAGGTSVTGACTNNYIPGEPGAATDGPGNDPKTNNLNGLEYIRPLVPGEQNYAAPNEPYYGGHPNPVRGNPAGAGLYTKGTHTAVTNQGDAFWRNQILSPTASNFKTRSLPVDWPPVPVNMAYPAECDYRNPGLHDNSLAVFGFSTNGIAEYTASNFGGLLKGNLLAAGFTSSGPIYRMVLSEDGKTVVNCPTRLPGETFPICTSTLVNTPGSNPLDVTALGDNGVFPGTIWTAVYGASSVYLFEPGDYLGDNPPTCGGEYVTILDEDGDGYNNADEIDNGSNPCSQASTPPDNDKTVGGSGFKDSDRSDLDDDDDGILDVNDAFALDPTNGGSNSLPVVYDLFNETGIGFGGVGFTGLMTNGTTDYLDQFIGNDVILGGTSGLATIPQVTDGTADGSTNTQDNAFQFGIDTDINTPPFTVEVQVNPLYFNNTLPQDAAFQGIQIGAGSQSDYIKLVINQGTGDASVPGFQFMQETANVTGTNFTVDVPGLLDADTDAVRLYLVVNPANGQVKPFYALVKNGSVGARVALNTSATLSGAALQAVRGTYAINGVSSGLAVGMIATSAGPTPAFTATWDYFYVYTETTSSNNPSATITVNGNTTFNNNTMQIANTGDVEIASVFFDLRGTFMPDIVFDPLRTGGDGGGKCFDANTQTSLDGTLGLTTPDNPTVDANNPACTTPFSLPNLNMEAGDTDPNVGYFGLTVNFTDFDPGESLGFSIDIDPTSIKGDTTTGDAGSISGFELAGALVTVTFEDGSILSNTIFGSTASGNLVQGGTVVAKNAPAAPAISVQGIATTPASVGTASQTIIVSGTPNAPFTLMLADARLYIDAGGGGYDIDPYEANEVVTKTVYTGTLNASGTASVPVTLLRTAPASGPVAGLNHLFAVINGTNGQNSRLSNVVILEYIPGLTTPTPTPTATQTATPTATPTTPASTCGPLSQQGENAQITGNFAVVSDGAALNGQYIHIPDGAGNSFLAPGSSTATFCFTVNESGQYKLQGRVFPLNSGGDSFWVTANGQNIVWSFGATGAYGQYRVVDVNVVGSAAPILFDWQPGEYTVVISVREDGARLDALSLIRVGDSAITPTPTPETPTPTATPSEVTPTATPTATDVLPTATPTATDVLPTATSTATPTATPTSTCGPLTQEAENALLVGAMQVLSGAASGGQFITSAEGSGNSYVTPGSGKATFCFNVTEAGDYKLAGLTKGTNYSSDSFWVQFGSNPAFDWYIPVGSSFIMDDVSDYPSNDAYVVTLAPGELTVIISVREDGAQLDTLSLVKVGGTTPTITPTPTGTPINPTPTATPGGSTCGPLSQQGEDAQITGNFAVVNDAAAVNGQYIHIPNNAGNSFLSPGSSKATFCFTVAQAGEYKLNGRLFAQTSNDDSFWVTVNGQNYVWSFGLSGTYGQYRTVDMTVVGSSTPVLLTLPAGEVTVVVSVREDGARLDTLTLIATSTNQPPVANINLLSVGSGAQRTAGVGFTAQGMNNGGMADPGTIAVPDRDGLPGELVTLDASGSFDPDGQIMNYVWTINGTVYTGMSVSVRLPDGLSSVTLVVEDNVGASSDAATLALMIEAPATQPTDEPTPTVTSTAEPTVEQPTATPTDQPTVEQPTATPTDEPTVEQPTATPTAEPTVEQPTATPTDEPTVEPTPTTLPNAAPVAVIDTASALPDTDGLPGERLVLSGLTSTDSDGQIVSYTWVVNGETTTGDTVEADLNDGANLITLTVVDDGGAMDTDTAVIMVQAPAAAPLAVLSLSLLDGTTGDAIDVLRNGAVLDQAQLMALNIRADTAGGAESVVFDLRGQQTFYQVRSTAPYALFDTAWAMVEPGAYTLTVTAFSADNAGGSASSVVTVSFTVVSGVSGGSVSPGTTTNGGAPFMPLQAPDTVPVFNLGGQ
ncbi:MAG: hypothetical protein OHK0046_42360 [Anaerolineae bacterium]